jgi:putative ABC transport system permease protein
LSRAGEKMKIESILDIIEVSFGNLTKQGFRTFLTLIGVIIGIAAIVSLLSIGQGLNVAVEKQFEELGSNTIFIIPGSGQTGPRIQLTNADLSKIESINGVDSVVPIYSTSGIMKYNNEEIRISINAADSKRAEIFENTGFLDVEEGRSFNSNESGSVIIGKSIAKDFFSKELTLRKRVLINGQAFRVIGILKPQSQSIGGGGPDSSATVFMSTQGLKRISTVDSPGIVFAKTISANNVLDVADEIKEQLESKYGKKSILVSTSEQLLEQINSFLSLITLFIVGIGGISLLVGGVGIMNAMVTSVMERTKEIGLLKALGASDLMIQLLFLFESAFIGAIGGIIGIIFGFGLASIIAIAGETSGFALVAVISWDIAIGALIFSMAIGMVSGFYPALRASKLDPIVALRYE